MKSPLINTALTVEKIRAVKGCENYTDEQANKIIESLHQFALLLYQHYQQQQTRAKKLSVNDSRQAA